MQDVAELEAQGYTVEMIDEELVFRQMAAEKLAFFLRYRAQQEGWHLIWGWYLDLACEYLEAQERREIRNLIINWPPSKRVFICAQIAIGARWCVLRGSD